MLGLSVISFALLWIPCASFSGVIAHDKGHSGMAWFFGGLFFGPLGLVAVAALSDRKLRRYIRLMAETKVCPRKHSAQRRKRPRLREPTDLYPNLATSQHPR